MPSSHPYSEYDPIIKKLRAEIASILRTPALEKSGIYYPESQIHFVNIDYNIEHLEKALMDISMFHNNAPIIENKYSCDLEFEVVEPGYIENSVNAVKVLIKAMDLTATRDTFEKKETKYVYNTYMTNLLLIKELVTELKNTVVDRVKLMDSLARGKAPPDLMFMLQIQSCMPVGQLESLEVNFCQKTKTGFFCELQINIYKSIQEYEKYVPVVYKGVQLRAESVDQLFVKSLANEHWGLIDCEERTDPEYDDIDSSLDIFTECNHKPYDNDCIKAIVKDDFDNVLKYCNFTHTKAQPVWRTNTGVLIMDTDMSLSVQELTKTDNQLKSYLPNKFPVHIVSNHNLGIQFKDKHIIFRPAENNSVTSITYTYLTEEFIHSMVKSADLSDILVDLTANEYIDIIYLMLFIVLVPIILTLCCIGIKRSDMWDKCKESKARKIYNRTRKVSRNLSENKKMMREMRQK